MSRDRDQSGPLGRRHLDPRHEHGDEPPITDAWIDPRAVGGAVLLALPLLLAVIGALCVPGWGSL